MCSYVHLVHHVTRMATCRTTEYDLMIAPGLLLVAYIAQKASKAFQIGLQHEGNTSLLHNMYAMCVVFFPLQME